MATVKGDVHDIGKNIVGVVLACNGFDVIDLGVMVPAHKILDTAVERDADLIGLSGPDHAVARRDVHGRRRDGAARPRAAAADRRRDHEQGPHRRQDRPLLPRAARPSTYPTRRAPSASRARCSATSSARRCVAERAGRVPRRSRSAARRAGIRRGARRLEQARENRLRIDWAAYAPPRAGRCSASRRSPTTTSASSSRYIDWTPFFRTWELKGTFPQILDDPSVGEVARGALPRRRGDARADRRRALDHRQRASSGSGRPTAVGDDIVVYADERRERPIATLHTLRQQLARDAAHPNLALADFVAPRDSGVADYVGAFAVTTGHGERERAEHFEREHDDYNAILFKALCDRLAEAFAERMHERVRRELWGYAPDESLDDARS